MARTEIEKKEQEGTEICFKDAVRETLRDFNAPDSPPTRSMLPKVLGLGLLGSGLGSGLGSVKQEPKPEPAGDRGSKRVNVKQEPKPDVHTEPAGDRGGKRAKSESYSKPRW